MAGVKGWYSAIGWSQPGMAWTGTKALERSGSRISGIALLLAASALGLIRPMPTAIQVSAMAKRTSSPNAASQSRTPASVDRKPMATATAPTGPRWDRLEHAADDVSDEHRTAVDRHGAEAGDDALGHVGGDGDRGPDHGAADGHQQQARDDVGDVASGPAAAADARAHRVAEDVDEEQQQHDRGSAAGSG